MCRRKIISWCQQIGQSCLKKLIVRTSCLGAGEGRLWWEERDSLWRQTGEAPQALLPGQG